MRNTDCRSVLRSRFDVQRATFDGKTQRKLKSEKISPELHNWNPGFLICETLLLVTVVVRFVRTFNLDADVLSLIL